MNEIWKCRLLSFRVPLKISNWNVVQNLRCLISDAIAHIVKFFTRKPLANYLDDYLFTAITKMLCDLQVQTFLDICSCICFPVSIEKTFWGMTSLTFLGLLIDTLTQIVSIPQEKIDKAKELISEALAKGSKKITFHQLQKIWGFLNFLGRAVVPGRAFTRRLYLKNSHKLKPHHHIKLNMDMRLDFELWLIFLNHPTAYSRPFMDFSKSWNAHKIMFYTDAFKVYGLGGICDHH